jgi:hypothetical protein
MVTAWRNPNPTVSVHMSRLGGWRVEVWQQGTLLYSETWDKRPTYREKEALKRKYRRRLKDSK